MMLITAKWPFTKLVHEVSQDDSSSNGFKYDSTRPTLVLPADSEDVEGLDCLSRSAGAVLVHQSQLMDILNQQQPYFSTSTNKADVYGTLFNSLF